MVAIHYPLPENYVNIRIVANYCQYTSGILKIPQPYVKEMLDIVFIFVIENVFVFLNLKDHLHFVFHFKCCFFFGRGGGGKLFYIVFILF